MNKTCNVCKKELPVASFRGNKTKKDGLQTHCIECGKQRNKQWYATNRVAKIKKSYVQNRKRCRSRQDVIWLKAEEVGCHFCSEKDRVVLDFHHLRDKEFNVSKGINLGYSWERLEDEIAKCVVLCSNCHRRVHAKQLTIVDPQIINIGHCSIV